MKVFCSFLFILFISGCFTPYQSLEKGKPPFADKSWVFEIQDNLLDEKINVDYFNKYTKNLNEKEKAYLTNVIESELSKSYSSLNLTNEKHCDEIFEVLAEKIYKQLVPFAKYKFNWNTAAAEDKIINKFYKKNQEAELKNSAKYNFDYIIDYEWKSVVDRSVIVSNRRGVASLKILMESTCSKDNLQKITVTIPEYIIQDPMTGMFYDKMAILSINWDKIYQTLDSADKVIERNSKLPIIKNIENKIKRTIEKRYSSLGRDSIKDDVIFDVEYEVALSRLQRHFNADSFDIKTTRFFINNGQFCIQKDICSDFETKFVLYPESNKKTSFVFSVKYQKINDSFTDKVVFSKKQSLFFYRQKILNEVRRIVMKE